MNSKRFPDIVGVVSALYTVEDIDAAVRLFKQWGLRLSHATQNHASLATLQGSTVVLTRPGVDAPGGLGELTTTPGFRGVVWGVRSEEDLALAHARLSECTRTRNADGVIWAADPFGYDIGFCLWQLPPASAAPLLFNIPGKRMRVSSAGARSAEPKPVRIGHVVFEVASADDLHRVRAFYKGALGFSTSDGYVDSGTFLRCAKEQDHHNVAILNVNQGINRFQHLAFEVQDIHSVFSGGVRFSEFGHETSIGPGRHKVSSAYFWYFTNPLGGDLEYFADMDSLDASWKPRLQPPDPASIAEWALPHGAKRFTSMRALKEDKT